MFDGDVHAHHQLPITCLLHLAHVQTCLLEVIIAAAYEHLQLVVQCVLSTHLIQLQIVLHVLVPADQALNCLILLLHHRTCTQGGEARSHSTWCHSTVHVVISHARCATNDLFVLAEAEVVGLGAELFHDEPLCMHFIK